MITNCESGKINSSDTAPEDISDGSEVVAPPSQGLAWTRQGDPPAAEAPAVEATAPAARRSRILGADHGWRRVLLEDRRLDFPFPPPKLAQRRVCLCGTSE